MSPQNLGEQFTLATEAIRLRASQATGLAHVRDTLDSRKAVDQAIGILMHQYNLNEKAALEVLQRRAVQADTQVHEVAAEMVADADSSGRALPPAAYC